MDGDHSAKTFEGGANSATKATDLTEGIHEGAKQMVRRHVSRPGARGLKQTLMHYRSLEPGTRLRARVSPSSISKARLANSLPVCVRHAPAD